MKGMLVHLLSGMNCTNGGITSKHSQFVLTGEGMPEIFEPSTDRAPELKLVKWYGFFKAVPVEIPPNMCGPMFGGNFVYTSDGRFSDVTDNHPVPVHDRFETQEMADSMR
jgi:hypothetical protein